ncbi:MAG TPA: fumarylacetoacetate hydrolase family protein [Gaiellaceae bacterium]|nr:fumarylacetoacetate hydrolase family protein [Gaiellaceae bacterium]
MGPALFRLSVDGRPRWAVGEPGGPPERLLPAELSLDRVLAGDAPLGRLDGGEAAPAGASLLAPLESQPVWAAGVTYLRSREARREESHGADFYDRVYDAERPELFFKASPGSVRDPEAAVAIRGDSDWNVPEPELALLADARGRVVAVTLGNDVSSRSIEGENPLYLPQAKVYDGSCSAGPCLVLVDPDDDLRAIELELEIVRDGEPLFADRVSVDTIRRDPHELVRWLHHSLSFPCGVLLLTGTSTVPPTDLTLAAGDRVSVSSAAIGQLANSVEVLPAGGLLG